MTPGSARSRRTAASTDAAPTCSTYALSNATSGRRTRASARARSELSEPRSTCAEQAVRAVDAERHERRVRALVVGERVRADVAPLREHGGAQRARRRRRESVAVARHRHVRGERDEHAFGDVALRRMLEIEEDLAPRRAGHVAFERAVAAERDVRAHGGRRARATRAERPRVAAAAAAAAGGAIVTSPSAYTVATLPSRRWPMNATRCGSGAAARTPCGAPDVRRRRRVSAPNESASSSAAQSLEDIANSLGLGEAERGGRRERTRAVDRAEIVEIRGDRVGGALGDERLAEVQVDGDAERRAGVRRRRDGAPNGSSAATPLALVT